MRATARHAGVLLAALASAAGVAGAAEAPSGPRTDRGAVPSPVLVAYDFEQPRATGPDTFWIRQPTDTEVALSTAFRFSGERSLRLREAPGNQDFAELLSYFDEVKSGLVFVQLYVLLADPNERFNIGLAGERWFLSREQHGHAVWIQTRDGMLMHQTRDGWHQLIAPRAFTWYFIDLMYDVDRGVYALRIDEEGAEVPLVDLRNQPAWHGQVDSSVRYLSVIGDLEDQAQADVFVDDLLVATDPAVLRTPFVAPGRRRFFVERLALAPPLTSAADRDELDHAARLALATTAGEASFDIVEWAGDEAFRRRDFPRAESYYRALLDAPDRQVRIGLKLADIAFLAGDLGRERELRERVYGRLRLEEDQSP